MNFALRGHGAPPGRAAPVLDHQLGAVKPVSGNGHGWEKGHDGRRRLGTAGPMTIGRHS
jgi:hypothetical protein